MPPPTTPTAGPVPSQGGASLSDILTAIQHLVTALNGAARVLNNVNGLSTAEGITAPTVIKTSAGRVASVSIITAGSSTGMLYDSANLTPISPIWVIPETGASNGEPYVVNMPTDSGLLVVPGSGQKVTVSWS